ncbi:MULTISPECIES: ComEC/Rec2 family competence protein [unclassified Tenacibaculum]|uniref:ComEC/Rec2 family competence protein n=1 Tax=unclassified Tenacibaculum TaxID=2635139 RepID=UPI001F439B77|nr:MULTISPECIES: ComEC/Rec2 family competence protein [unclassified Tenacibaculum]MCF2875285.1 ComEC family competence protein [Tenacibaculum sp. Cn5-1]MCF2935361.1 ComEC family competence protein [Tenacibaculum sp. Cn5-34]MCG7511921.1 ComEC family competence protein [Tenacibaculum sp. Cn5-46]
MRKLLNFLPFHFLLCIICGIILQYFFKVWQYNFISTGIVTISTLSILYILKRKKLRKLFSVTALLLFIFIGVSTTFINNPKNYSNFYYKFASKNSSIVLVIRKKLRSNKYYHKFVAQIVQVDTKKTTGNILLNIKKDSSSFSLKIDDRVFMKAQFKDILSPLNPYQFNYKHYLAKQYIYHQAFINKNEFKLLKDRTFSLIGLAENFRNKIQSSLNKLHFKPEERAVINALLLGERKNISRKLLESYTKAGAIHILAISGLHVGIILLILNNLFKPLEKLKYGRIATTLFVILLLWSFAFITGLSASVVRAVTMFSFLNIGKVFEKKKVIEFSIISSMFFLLLIKPLFLFDIGFQLSYLAVFGIIWIQPRLSTLWKPKFFFFKKFWDLFTVSIAAQISVLPISLFYFHQFPSLFIISNLIIIPCLTFILIGGILIIILASCNSTPSFLINSYAFIISKMNKVIDWISNQEKFLFQEISMSFYEMMFWYLILIFSFQFIISKKVNYFIYTLTTVLFLQGHLIFKKYIQENKQEVIVFHNQRKNLIGIRNGKKLQVFQSLDILNNSTKNIIKNYNTNESINKTVITPQTNVFKFKSDTILIIDSLNIYKLSIKNSIVILQNSPKVNLVRLISTLNPKLIIADGSNYKSDVTRWNLTCKNKKTPFYYTGKNGAYFIN